MSTLSKSPLVQAFLADHQQFMKLLHDVSLALDAGDIEHARQLGATLDEVAGPHIAFEEQVLYPNLRRLTHDHSFVRSLYDEHRAIVEALTRLLSDDLDPESLEELNTEFKQGLQHAEHCGTLISRLSAMDESDQQEALGLMNQLRSSCIKWTQFKRGT